MHSRVILNITNETPKKRTNDQINDDERITGGKVMENFVPFVSVCFSENNEFIATVDQRYDF